MLKFVFMAMAGGLGALARYGLGGLVHKFLPQSYPWGTTVVNISGCLFFGFIWALAETRLSITAEHRLIVLTGFMGSFTTFSTFIFESGILFREGQWLPAIANLAAQNILGLLALFLGFMLARQV